MKIAVLGAPESGKSAFANNLGNLIAAPVLDDYIPDIEARFEIALQNWMASYIGNIHIASERILYELRDTEQHSDLIVCGTIIETLIYTSMLGVMSWEINRSSEDHARIDMTLQMLTFLLRDTWDYDAAYYLPYQGTNKLNIELDRNIPVALEAFEYEYKTIDRNFTARDAAREIITDSKKTE